MKRKNAERAQPVWSAGAVSEKGLREENQDRMTRFQSAWGEVILVADGIGGSRGGATAAETVTRGLAGALNNILPGTPAEEALQQAVSSVNREIHQRGNSGDASVAKMGSTLVLALIRETTGGVEAKIANIGDSRAYLLRNGNLQLLSRDHTAVQRLVDAGAISAEAARTHPEASILTRALGQQPEVALDFAAPVRLGPGDGLLLCSDGLSGYANEEAILQTLASHREANAAVRALLELALRSGSEDNITIQFVRMSGAAIPPAAIPEATAKFKFGGAHMAAALLALTIAGAGVWEAKRILQPRKELLTQEIRIKSETGSVPLGRPSATAKKQPSAGAAAKNEPSQNDSAKKNSAPDPSKTPAANPEAAVAAAGVSGAVQPNLEAAQVTVKPVLLLPAMKTPPAWFEKLKALDCVETREGNGAPSTSGAFRPDKKRFVMVYRSAVSSLVKDCLLAAIPGAEVKSVSVKVFERLGSKAKEKQPEQAAPPEIWILAPQQALAEAPNANPKVKPGSKHAAADSKTKSEELVQ